MDDDDTPYCVDGCGRPATTERFEDVIIGLDGELYEVVELVCVHCARPAILRPVEDLLRDYGIPDRDIPDLAARMKAAARGEETR